MSDSSSIENRVEQFDKHLFAVDNVLSHERCRDLIEFSEQVGYEPATLSGQRKQTRNAHVRNNDRVILDDPELADELWNRVGEFLPARYLFWKPVGLNERFRFYRYDPGQRFVWHMDGSFRRENGDESKVTLLFYLNENMEGGATSFKGFRVEPSTGRALFFLHKYLHQGETVSKGRKYVLRTDVMYRLDSNALKQTGSQV